MMQSKLIVWLHAWDALNHDWVSILLERIKVMLLSHIHEGQCEAILCLDLIRSPVEAEEVHGEGPVLILFFLFFALRLNKRCRKGGDRTSK